MAYLAAKGKGQGVDRPVADAVLEGADLARRLAPWFGLQLAFAARCAELAGLSLGAAATTYTAIYKRMGFGPNARETLAPDWLDIMARIDAAGDEAAALDVVMREMQSRIVGYRHYSRDLFGCFSFDRPDEAGAVKLHFIPDHSDAETGPLHRSNRADRMAELKTMFAHIRAVHGERAKAVRGLSWLYHTGAYRSLFPEAFAASVTPDHGAGLPQGMRYWGQFLTHRGHLRPDMADAFRAALPGLNLDRLADAFPCPPLRAEAPIAPFYRHLGL